jgi:hypothetical protein
VEGSWIPRCRATLGLCRPLLDAINPNRVVVLVRRKERPGLTLYPWIHFWEGRQERILFEIFLQFFLRKDFFTSMKCPRFIVWLFCCCYLSVFIPSRRVSREIRALNPFLALSHLTRPRCCCCLLAFRGGKRDTSGPIRYQASSCT